jgi:hypothetical protein
MPGGALPPSRFRHTKEKRQQPDRNRKGKSNRLSVMTALAELLTLQKWNARQHIRHP